MNDRRLALLDTHAEAERRFDLEATLATLAPDPVFEFHPDGRRIVGTEAARAMYASFLPTWEALEAKGRLEFLVPRGVWFHHDTRMREEVAVVRDADGAARTFCFVVGVSVGDDGIRGERFYGSPVLLEALMGAHYATLPFGEPPTTTART
jgi:hypothetical protein